MQPSSSGPGDRPKIRLFNPDAPPPYDGEMPNELTVREIFESYLAHSESKGRHTLAARSQRYQTLLGITLYRDKVTKQLARKTARFPGFADVVLPDGRKLGDCPVSAMKPHYLEDWIDNNKRFTSSSTRKSKANQVNAAMNWAVKGKRISENPFGGVDYEESEPRKPMGEEFLGKISDLCNKPFEELAAYLRLVSRRLGEVCNMDWEHIDWKKLVVKVTKFKGRKKLRKDQNYALIPEAVQLLERIRLRKPDPLTGPVFLNTRGTRWTPGNAGLYLRRLKSRHKLSGGTIHSIRHQAITEMIRGGGNLKAVSQQAGHADTRITEKFYCHMEEAFDEMREAAKKGVKPPAQQPPTTPPAE